MGEGRGRFDECGRFESGDRRHEPPAIQRFAATLDEYSAHLAPLTLPPEIEWFWRTYGQPAMEGLFDLLIGPQLDSPKFSLYNWNLHADIRAGGEIQLPANLVSVLYSSHWFHLTDLAVTEPGRPGVLWDWMYGLSSFELRHASLAALFRATTEMLELHGEPVPTDRIARMDVRPAPNDPAFRAIAERHLIAAGYGDAVRSIVADDHLSWPLAWRVASGIGPEATSTSQPTHTAASFLEAARRGPVTGRLHGRCRECLGGGIGPGGSFGAIMVFTDATGSLPLLLLEGVTVIGARSGRFEVEVEAAGPVGDLPSPEPAARAQQSGLAGDHESAEFALAEMIAAAREAMGELPRITRMVALGD